MDNHNKTLHAIIRTLLFGLLGWQFASMFWLGDQHLYVDQLQVYGPMEKPFAYRLLIPLLARLIIWLMGVRVDLGLVIAVALSAVAAILAMSAFLEEFDGNA
jgi:uncharacterized membrane protein (DUF373 family)